MGFGARLGGPGAQPPTPRVHTLFSWLALTRFHGSPSLFWAWASKAGFAGVRAAWPSAVDPEAWAIIASFGGLQAALQLALPGRRVTGPVTPAGNVPVYKANGVASYLTTLGVLAGATAAGWVDPSRVYDKWGEILSALNAFSLLFCAGLWAKVCRGWGRGRDRGGRSARGSPRALPHPTPGPPRPLLVRLGVHRVPCLRLLLGHGAVPAHWEALRHQDVDQLPVWHERVGHGLPRVCVQAVHGAGEGWVSFLWSGGGGAARSDAPTTSPTSQAFGRVTDSMLVCALLINVYLFKFFVWEVGYWARCEGGREGGRGGGREGGGGARAAASQKTAPTHDPARPRPSASMDIAHDRAGYYICWGCLVWVPAIYASPALFLAGHPRDLGALHAGALFAAGLAAIWINYDADRQRQVFRATKGRAKVWGRAPVKLVARYATADGSTKSSLLLASGWWGLARHFHYAPEIAAAFLWTAPAGFAVPLPYFYVAFLTALLVDRAFRDDARCAAKYGAVWDAYRALVPARIVPGVF